MKKTLKTLLTVILAAALLISVMPASVLAAGDPFFVVGYEITTNIRRIMSGNTPNIKVTLMRTDGLDTPINVIRNVDDFQGGGIDNDAITHENGVYTFTVFGPKYKGEGNVLKLTVKYNDGSADCYQVMDIAISECVPASSIETAPDPSVDPLPEPRAYFSTEPFEKDIAADDSAKVTVYIKNMGSTVMNDPIVYVSPSEGLILTSGKTSCSIPSIGAGKTEVIEIPIKAVSRITSQNQSLDLSMSFTYNNRISDVTGSSEGRIVIPAEITKDPEVPPEEPDPEKPTPIDSPVPMVILTGFDYGGEAIAAGSEMTLDFSFKNTSKNLTIENVLLTVTGGADLMINGATNTFYFDRIPAGGERSVSVPFKAPLRVSGTTQDVSLNFSYEYVDNSRRSSNTSDLHISIPLYQPDRLEFSAPSVPYVGFIGEEVSLTIDYVNRGKSEISNVEAVVSGDVSSSNPFIRVGNLESGKSGTIAFAVAPMMEGSNTAVITITYEGPNGEQVERTFETVLTPMEDWGGEWDEPIDDPSFEEEGDDGTSFPWWIIPIVVAAAVILVLVLVKSKKKKAKAAKEKAMWDAWEESELKAEESKK